jgi:hypothetical protein
MMEILKQRIRWISHWILMPLMVALGGLCIHELGHGLIACLWGGTVTYFEIMPGMELYPELAFHPWNGLIAQIRYTLPDLTPFQEGCIALMGSGTTLCAAGLALGVLLFSKARGGFRRVLIFIAALFPLDMIAYSTFPALGLRHWIIIGGRTAEPVHGAVAMGIPVYAFYIGLGVSALVLYGILFAWMHSGRVN